MNIANCFGPATAPANVKPLLPPRRIWEDPLWDLAARTGAGILGHAAILAEQAEHYKPGTDHESSALAQNYAFNLSIVNGHMHDLKKNVPPVRLIALPEANFYVFLANQDDLLREIGAFLTGLK